MYPFETFRERESKKHGETQWHENQLLIHINTNSLLDLLIL
jgi:hypothetical protein